ncbi:hypothetical protein QTL86_06605 [Cellulosilyticum sp. ST5]|uniref:hypothetical protein n=1 Tax=Cellulosilyticum sp. ST5 TaxID=3055805 RepID=UPI00397799F1
MEEIFVLETSDKIGYEEWDENGFIIPDEYQLNENSKLHEAINVFYTAGGYDFFKVIRPEKYATNWLDYISELYNDIVEGKYQPDGNNHSILLSDAKRKPLIEQGVPEVFTSDM